MNLIDVNLFWNAKKLVKCGRFFCNSVIRNKSASYFKKFIRCFKIFINWDKYSGV